jgi:hypothetical protein
MVRFNRLGHLGAGTAIVLFGFLAQAQIDPGAAIQNKLASQIKLTKTAADRSDIVTAGDVAVLHRDGLMMCSFDTPYAFSNTYANGALTANYKNRAKNAAKSFLMGKVPLIGGGTSAADAANNGCNSRKFVAGEKFWITAIAAHKDGILVSTYSDPYNDIRFYGEILFAYPKGSIPAPDDFAKTVAEVITVDGADNQGGQGNAAPAAAAPPPAAPMQAIAPPPPPPDAAPPPTIAIGQTKAQVTALFGQPAKTSKVGVKEIYFYQDMKVTFSNGKVSNVE